MTDIPKSQKQRLYAVEFLRIFFVFFIILGHASECYPEIKSFILKFFNTEYTHLSFGVEFFFIIGGFFLYKRILTTQNIFHLIQKIYSRLFFALLFVFLSCVAIGVTSIYNFPQILFLTTGLSIPGAVTGWGDWYVGVYFWCSLLFIGLFYGNIRRGFLCAAILSYLALCLKFHAPDEGWMKTYYTIIGNQLVRGIYSITLGILAAFLADKVSIPRKKGIRIIFTICEVYLLFSISTYMMRSSHSHFNFLEIELVFVLLLICIANSLGYISDYLNNISKVQMISRYSYSIFLGHIPFVRYLTSHASFGLGPATCGLIIIGGGIMTGIFEYHIVEKKIVPWIAKYFTKEVA